MPRISPRVNDFFLAVTQDINKFCKAMNFSPTWQQQMLLDAVQRATDGTGKDRIAVKSGQGPGKCLTGDTLVMTDRGAEPIEDLIGEEFRVVGMDQTSQKLRWADGHAFESGKKVCYRLQLDSGHEIEGSHDHPIYTDRGWVKIRDLKEKDFVACARSLPGPEQATNISDEEIIFVAYMLAEGSTSSGNCGFCQQDNDVLREMQSVVEYLGGSVKYIDRYDYRINGLHPLVRKWDMAGKKAKEKRIPPEFFLLSDRQLSLFINRFWACDGYMDKDGPGICLASEDLIRDLRTALLRFAINTRSAYKASRCNGKVFDSWRLQVFGQGNLLRWDRNIKNIKHKPFLYKKCKANSNTDLVPILEDQVKEIANDLGVTRYKLREKGFRGRKYNYWSRDKFQKMIEIRGYSGEYARLADNDLIWCRVSSIRRTGRKKVYDLSVPETESFVANNIIVHNTTVSGIVGLWRTMRNYGALTIVTAPTMRQCTEVWLTEVRRLLQKADPALQRFFEVTNTRVSIAGERDWGIKMVTATREENAQGYHQGNMTVICEEASGIPEKIVTQFKGTLSNPNSMLLMIGNPNSRDCEFFKCFHSQRSEWESMTFNAEETARDYPHILSPKRNEAIAKEFGRDSDVYKVRVMGEFPSTDPNCVMSIEDIEKVARKQIVLPSGISRNRLLEHARNPRGPYGGIEEEIARQFGIDFARFGGDENTIFRRQGNAIVNWSRHPHTDPNDVFDMAVRQQYEAEWPDEKTWYIADAGGLGQGVMGNFHRAGKNIMEFHTQARAGDAKMYENRMTEAWFMLAKRARRGDCYIPMDDMLMQQLVTRQYFVNKKGRLVLESKDDYIKRGHHSPDRADGLVMAMYDRVVVAGHISAGSSPGKSVGTDYRN